MASQAIEAQREGAEIYQGEEICKQKTVELLNEIELPNGLLFLEEIEEVGYNRKTGFVWLKRNKAVTHLFHTIDKDVMYGEEIYAFVEKGKLKKIHGVKSKELLVWVTIGDIHIDEKHPDKITFQNRLTGLSRTFPVSAFTDEELEKKKKDGEVKVVN
ncbi:plant/protein (Protein of unknown function, DUF538) [Thalictrum thalictroides]|uniref:Uncharacterized protein n=1 Tax=Thalictrum thalictroides TaxID=46969 RepID=A0A7J6V1E7_THATH|nr:plant/protein (Protein of unknown function, DUF538) [Thalictrum thalictroides]